MTTLQQSAAVWLMLFYASGWGKAAVLKPGGPQR